MLESSAAIYFLISFPVVVVAALCWWTHFLGRRAGEVDRTLIKALQDSHEAHCRDLGRAGKSLVSCVEATGKVANGLRLSLDTVTGLAVKLDTSKATGHLLSQAMAHLSARQLVPPGNGAPIVRGYQPPPEPEEPEEHPEITEATRM